MTALRNQTICVIQTICYSTITVAKLSPAFYISHIPSFLCPS